MTYTSHESWDTNISTSGGSKNMVMYTSPFSSNPAANALQGSLTNGQMINEFEPETPTVYAADTHYYVGDRQNMTQTNAQVDTVNQSDTTSDGEAFRSKSLVAPSRRSEKFTVNPSRRQRAKNTTEKFSEIPGLRGSHMRHESFTTEESYTIIIVILSIIALCVVGVSAGVLIPRFNVAISERKPGEVF